MLCPDDKSRLFCYATQPKAHTTRHFYKCKVCKKNYVTEEAFVDKKPRHKFKPLSFKSKKSLTGVSHAFVEEPDTEGEEFAKNWVTRKLENLY